MFVVSLLALSSLRDVWRHHECDHLDWSGKFEAEMVAGQVMKGGEIVPHPRLAEKTGVFFGCGKSGPTSYIDFRDEETQPSRMCLSSPADHSTLNCLDLDENAGMELVATKVEHCVVMEAVRQYTELGATCSLRSKPNCNTAITNYKLVRTGPRLECS
jgi:hypothetical protein